MTLERLRRRPELGPLVSLVEEAGSGTVPASPRELILPDPGGERRLEIALRPLSSASDRAGWVVAVEDTTHVAREQKLAAWSEVARRVAHEIKNPLTPIRLSAERIARRLRAGGPDLAETIERGTKVIVDEVSFLKSLVDEFSRFARLPEMRPEPVDLPDAEFKKLFDDMKNGADALFQDGWNRATLESTRGRFAVRRRRTSRSVRLRVTRCIDDRLGGGRRPASP